VLLTRSERSKEPELLMLRHALSILRWQVNRTRLEQRDRLLFAAVSRLLPQVSRRAFGVSPETLLRWRRRLDSRCWTPAAGAGDGLESAPAVPALLGRVPFCSPRAAKAPRPPSRATVSP
jgi:hypothetical protein